MEDSKSLLLALTEIQKKLKAPKNQRNSFGNYNYRSCEDILEAVKPLLKDLALIITDEIVNIGDRFYVKATVKLFNTEGEINVFGFARESLTKKGMDESQITGASSSYARKYALNGMFLIDDTKDADTMDNSEPKEDVTDKWQKGTEVKTEQKKVDSLTCPECQSVLSYREGISKAGKPYKGYFCSKCKFVKWLK